jgi:hypothetical protein
MTTPKQDIRSGNVEVDREGHFHPFLSTLIHFLQLIGSETWLELVA